MVSNFMDTVFEDLKNGLYFFLHIWNGWAHNFQFLGAAKTLQIDADPTTRMRAAEQVLFKILEELFQLADHDLDRCDSRTLALIMSVATVLKVCLLIVASI